MHSNKLEQKPVTLMSMKLLLVS